MSITRFAGEYAFLSNFHPCSVSFEGHEYRSVEHAYVAAKTEDERLRAVIRNTEKAGDVKRMGRELVLRPGWDKMRVPVMWNLQRQKYEDDHLSDLLQRTRPHELIEGNYWNDTFWGQCPLGNGQNKLGIMLMDIRDDPLGILS